MKLAVFAIVCLSVACVIVQVNCLPMNLAEAYRSAQAIIMEDVEKTRDSVGNAWKQPAETAEPADSPRIWASSFGDQFKKSGTNVRKRGSAVGNWVKGAAESAADWSDKTVEDTKDWSKKAAVDARDWSSDVAETTKARVKKVANGFSGPA